jgi:hypothetical protein
MKKFYLCSCLVFCLGLSAQTVNIPDPLFKAALLESDPEFYHAYDNLGNYIVVDANSDGEIQNSEALNVYGLAIPEMQISNLTGILSFANLEVLDCSYNQLTSLNLSGMSNLLYLTAGSNSLTTLNVTGCNAMISIECDFNQLTALDLSGLNSLETLVAPQNLLTSINLSGLNSLGSLEITGNQLTTLDLSGCPNVLYLSCAFNQLTSLDISSCHPEDVLCDSNQITELIVKNGTDESNFNIIFYNNPITHICADEMEVAGMISLLELFEITDCAVNSYCSFTPGGTYYTIQGTNRFDANNNGCDAGDIAHPNLKFSITSDTAPGTIISDGSGAYSITVPEGNYTITPVFENASYFQFSPASFTANFPADASPMTQNICISPNGSHPDLEIVLLELEAAVPGFDSAYKIVCRNKGNQVMSGAVSLTYENDVLDLVSSNPVANQSGNMLSWNLADLLPSESKEFLFTLNLNAPTETPPLNINDELDFVAQVTTANDEMPDDNSHSVQQIVVGSFDPNDITCLEGTVVSTDLIGEYVHYQIRFENTGTFPARNIVVRDDIDLSKFDINTLVPYSGSHSFVTKVSEPNRVEFIFENINLPFDDAHNDGYVAFKIKTHPTLVAGNTFSNTAAIYFDYNFPVMTDPATTLIQVLARHDFEFSDYFKVYPNPANEVLHFESRKGVVATSISIYNNLGQLVLAIPNAGKSTSVDISELARGSYFIKVNSDKGVSNTKFIKN